MKNRRKLILEMFTAGKVGEKPPKDSPCYGCRFFDCMDCLAYSEYTKRKAKMDAVFGKSMGYIDTENLLPEHI